MKYINGILIILLIIIFSFISSLFAGTTGKICGYIKDAETGEGLPGTNIIIDGTMMGAASDLEGYFTIINVSPGVYTLKASMMGYQTRRIENVRVSIDLTTTVDFKLSSSIFGSGYISTDRIL